MSTIGRVDVRPYCTVVAHIEINDRLLYYFLGPPYYSQVYHYIKLKRPELWPEFALMINEETIAECGGKQIDFFFEDIHCQYIHNIFEPFLQDSNNDWILMWRTLKEAFAVAYYVCTLVDDKFTTYKPDGYFEALCKNTTGYTNLGPIYDVMMDCLAKPYIEIYRQVYTVSLAKFRLFQSLLTEPLYAPNSQTCTLM